jgi:acyl-CoA ligase (AMP-forming) (exosortase A-associated)
MGTLLHHHLLENASRSPSRIALDGRAGALSYGELGVRVETAALALLAGGLQRGDRVAIWLDKRIETVVSIFGTSLAGGVFVPINPILKAEQAAYILRDCNCRVLLTSPERLAELAPRVDTCPDLRQAVTIGKAVADPRAPALQTVDWDTWMASIGTTRSFHRTIESDIAAILYTSGSTGKPKGVVLSHRNMVAGALSVASYLENTPEDRLLAVLPLSFDYGLSQLTTAFSVGASVVLHNYLLAADVIKALVRHRITGLAAVPPLWLQLTALDWPASIDEHLRYFTNSGGAMPTSTLAALRARAPRARPFLMYGLTEAFRSTYLPPDEIDRRPTSMGKAIPNAEILVVREDGCECGPGEPGELVHRGPLVALGYWNDAEKTAERFKPLPAQRPELVLPEIAVWSGDTVKKDEDGFLYFVSRRDEMIKTSGYRVSPTEVEEVLYRTGRVAEVAAFGVDHPTLGQAIVVVAQPAEGQSPDSDGLVTACKAHLPQYMLPARIDWVTEALPRNANGKIDRKRLSTERATLFMVEASH